MILTKKVTTRWVPKTLNHYLDKGYTFTKLGDPLEVKVEDLTSGSNIKVMVRCEMCLKDREAAYHAIVNNVGARCMDCSRRNLTEPAAEKTATPAGVPPKGVAFEFNTLSDGKVTTERLTSKSAPPKPAKATTVETVIPSEAEMVVEFSVRSKDPRAIKEFFQGLFGA